MFFALFEIDCACANFKITFSSSILSCMIHFFRVMSLSQQHFTKQPNHQFLVLLSHRCFFPLSSISLNIQISTQISFILVWSTNLWNSFFYSSFCFLTPFYTKSTFQMRFDKFFSSVVVIVILSEIAFRMQQKFLFFIYSWFFIK